MAVRIIETIPLFSGWAGITGVWRLVRSAFAAVLLSVVLSSYATAAEDAASSEVNVDWETIIPMELEKLLVRGDLDANARIEGSKGVYSPLINAVKYSADLELLNVLVKHGADIHWSDPEPKFGFTALHFATYAGKVGHAQRLLELGADVNRQSEYGPPPIFGAAYKGIDNVSTRLQILDLLLLHGADLYAEENISDRYAQNLLMVVAIHLSFRPNERENYVGLLNYLVTLGIHPDSAPTRNKGISALHLAILISGDEYAVKEFVRLGADVNLYTTAGATPLIFFARFGISMDVWDELLAHGADIDATDSKNKSVLYYARIRMKGGYDFVYERRGEKSSFSSVEEWRALGGEIVAHIESLCEKRQYRICDELDEDVDLPTIPPDMDVWDALLAQGADINAMDDEDKSVLYHASMRMKGAYDFIYELRGKNSPFSSVEEWRAFGGEIVARIELLCEEGEYRVCDELDEDVDSQIISPELEKTLIQGLKLWLLL